MYDSSLSFPRNWLDLQTTRRYARMTFGELHYARDAYLHERLPHIAALLYVTGDVVGHGKAMLSYQVYQHAVRKHETKCMLWLHDVAVQRA